MVGGINAKLFEFQENAVLKLIDFVNDSNSKRIITMKSPTGSGKTLILIDFVDEYLSKINSNTAFIWLCPGKGDLEVQSCKKMQKFAPHLFTQNLFDSLQSGFIPESTTFVNWELVTKNDNKSLRDSERKNLFDRIAEANRNKLQFIIIIDEEHSNDTAKANKIIDAFSAKNIIRVSATAEKNPNAEYFEIDEREVIDAGLITKAIYVNEGITEGMQVDNDYDILLELADNKRKEIAERFTQINKTIRPLVLIQFPSAQPDTIKTIEDKLESMGYSYNNGMVAKWMSDGEKINLSDNLTQNDGVPVFLLMKQAISTGWDCPRAKILVKLRENMSQEFTIQTLGRIRRMPEAKHYDDSLLDFCYVYTFDKKYATGLLNQIDKAYVIRRLFLKEKCKTFTIEKQMRNFDIGGLGEREVMNLVRNYLIKKYKLGRNYEQNKLIMEDAGYIFGTRIYGQTLVGRFVLTSSLLKSNNYHAIYQEIDTHKHGIYLLHSIDEIKTSIHMQTSKVKTILERLFRNNGYMTNNLINLRTKEFYAFIINNVKKLKQEFREVTAGMTEQLGIEFNPKTCMFKIPEQDFYKYDANVKNEKEYLSNAYKNYTSGFVTELVKSKSELLFEQYCEKNDEVEWVYKNGDSGQQYFSIVYVDNLRNQWLFYADYIVKKKDGSIWIIETKGGESRGQNKNIDLQIENKFNAFKNYANNKNINWGFVRDKDNLLYINNTDFVLDMADDNIWKPLENVF